MSGDDARYLEDYRARMDNHVLQERHDGIRRLRDAGGEPFANGFEVDTAAADLFEAYGDLDNDGLVALERTVRVAGRIRFFRRMGKAAFIKIQDRSCRPGVKPPFGDAEVTDDFLQVFVSKRDVGDDAFDAILGLDLGDIVGAVGTLMRTRTGELSVQVQRLELLTKSTRPLPEKFRGLTDVEQRYRQRYVDLIMNDDVRESFMARTRMLAHIRRFFDERGFLEVETPMMHVTPGGATARPFVTHHNALDIELFLRIAPELYLKRLLVGGMERVYELNRNFRNEGLSRRHNPEFTMLEFYQAYATYEDLMELTETLVCELASELHEPRDDGRLVLTWDGMEIDLTRPWRRLGVTESVADALGMDRAEVWDRAALDAKAAARDIDLSGIADDGKAVFTVFEALVETSLVSPTFVVDFPASVSPLARRKPGAPHLVDRFELFVGTREIANGFNELNDPEDQYVRFARQLAQREAGDEEAMPIDEDYVRALEYGMPPAAGEGIGIDRLVMMLTDAANIRDVILFPHMRPEADPS